MMNGNRVASGGNDESAGTVAWCKSDAKMAYAEDLISCQAKIEAPKVWKPA